MLHSVHGEVIERRPHVDRRHYPKPELLATEPQVLVAVGPGAAGDVDDLAHPLARAPFSEAREGVPFAWTRGTSGLRLPSLAPALDDEANKRRFWRCFLVLRDLAA